MVIPYKIDAAKSNFVSTLKPKLILIPSYQFNYLCFFWEKIEISIPKLKKLVFFIRLTIVNLFLPFSLFFKRKKNQLL